MIISWNTTQACNIHCRHCYRDAGARRSDELTTSEGEKLLEQIAAAGFRIMVFSGGEPLLRSDIFHLIAYAKRMGLRPVIGTNGTLIADDTAEQLHQAGLAVAGISIDSSNPVLHNQFRQSENAWDKTMAGIAALKRAGVPFQIHTTAMDWNAHEILGITDLAVQWGAIAHHIFFLVPAGRGKDIAATTLTTSQYEDLLQQILIKQLAVPIELKPTCAPQFMRIARERGMAMRYTRGCLAGTAYCVILPNGDVQPCPYLPLKVDNVRTKSFQHIWRDNPLFRQLRTQPLKGGCGKCGFTTVCGGCRARAFYYSGGDVFAEEPWCSRGR